MNDVQDTLSRLQEVGRTVSKANEGKIRAAITALQEILSKLSNGENVEEADKKKAVREAKQLIEAELSHDQIRQRLRMALQNENPTAKRWYYIRDVYSNNFVYEDEPRDDSTGRMKLYKRTYVIDDNGKVTMGDPVEVVQETTYKPVTPQQESATDANLKNEFVPLVEKAVRKDGTIPIKIISPGWGTSGYYSESVLKRDAGVYKPGTKMYWDHPTVSEEAERPERSLRDLAAVLTTGGKYDANGPDGPGVYAEAKVFPPYREALPEVAPYIGLSHRAMGKAKHGEAEGRTGPIIESIAVAQSVDFVTDAGRGGKILELFEAARTKAGERSDVEVEWSAISLEEVKRNRPDLIEGLRTEIKTAVYGDKNKFEEAKKLSEEKLKELQEKCDGLETENKRLKESLILRESRDFVLAELKESKLPEITKQRLLESLAKAPVLNDKGELDKEGFKTKIKEALDAEIEYLAKVTGSGDIKGMGEGKDTGGEVNLEEVNKDLESAFSRLGLSESAAKTAAEGRK